jgi:3-phenylpropionate/cinnamic acid dioxygenase small subunit
MTLAELAAIESCRALLYAYAERVDAGRASSVLELFTENARFSAGPRTLVGRSELAPAFAAREADTARRTRHLVSNPVCAPAGDGAMDVRSTLAVFVLGDDAPLAPRALVECVDRMERGADARWRIARRDLHLLAGKP